MDKQIVAEHYNQRRNEGRQGRKSSRIYRMRNFNNWLKTVLINLHTKPGYSVLDLCCGKGGDLQKWHSSKCTTYVACDIAQVSVKIALERYNNLRDPTFRPVLLVGDCFSARIANYLDEDIMFDVVSCQFAMHYAFESEQRVRMLLSNVTERLKPGGFFIGTTVDADVLVSKLRAVSGLQIASDAQPVYKVRFDKQFADKRFDVNGTPYGVRYNFTLDQSVEDCPEYLVHFPTFQKVANEYDLELMLIMNFHDFFVQFSSEKYGEFRDLLFSMDVLDENGGINADEWDAIYLYTAFAFRKKGGEANMGIRASETGGRDWAAVSEHEILKMESET